MAENKKSFLLYADASSSWDELTDEEAGQLIKHIFSYVNDKNPVTENRIVKIAFEPIKQQLKRDLKHWENVKNVRSESGRIGGIKSGETRKLKSEANEANALKSKQNEANEAVNVNVNVNDIDESTTSSLFSLKMLSCVQFGINEFTRYACSQTKRTEQQLIELMQKFISEQNALSKLSWPSEKDAKAHFINWVKKQPLSTAKPFHLQRPLN